MQIDFASYSDIGRRDVNEDSLMIKTYENGMLMAVADGLGGHGGGEIASSLVLDRLDALMRPELPILEQALKTICNELNSAVLSAQNANCRMKTTLAMVAIVEDTLVCVHIGDSRIYFLSGGEIRYQSADHSVSQLAVFSGEITKDQIRFHEDRSKLLRSLGNEDPPNPDIRIFEHTLRAGDALLLCTDGFWEFVREKEMLVSLARARTVSRWLNNMVRFVKRRARGKKNDNNTAIAIRLIEGESMQ